MGNLNRKPTRGLTSTQAPALLLRSVFALLEQRWDGAPLPRRGNLATRTICAETGAAPHDDSNERCRRIDELFSLVSPRRLPHVGDDLRPRILVPSPGIIIARDPRIPDRFERLGLALDRHEGIASIRWYVDNQFLGEAPDSRRHVSWELREGKHFVSAEVRLSQSQDKTEVVQLGPVGFTVR